MARLSIGEFARASGLSPKALRLYDELGLVAWLRALGMPLTRIRVLCDAHRDAVVGQPVRAGDRYLLCTDGLHAVLGDQRIHDVSASR